MKEKEIGKRRQLGESNPESDPRQLTRKTSLLEPAEMTTRRFLLPWDGPSVSASLVPCPGDRTTIYYTI